MMMSLRVLLFTNANMNFNNVIIINTLLTNTLTQYRMNIIFSIQNMLKRIVTTYNYEDPSIRN